MNKGLFWKGIVFGIVVLFVGSGIIPSVIGINKEKTSNQFIGSRGYIQDLIDNASDGDTIYIPSGTYYGEIVINKSINLIGENKENTIIDGEYEWESTILTINANHVNFSNFTITNVGPYSGIVYMKSDFNNFKNNIISDGDFPRWSLILSSCNFNNIINNTIGGMGLVLSSCKFNNVIDNTIYGIALGESENNIIINNQISWFSGIHFIVNNSNNTLIGNTISNCNEGISFGDVREGYNTNNTIKNNIISNNYNGIAFYLHGTQINNNIIDSNVIFNNFGEGICLSGANNIITNNTITNNSIGIKLNNAHLNTITENIITNNIEEGILLDYENSDINIFSNNISNNKCGISIDESDLNNIYNNIIFSNKKKNINLRKSNRNSIFDNKISKGKYGIYLNDKSDYNTITNNSCISNKFNGIFIESSDYNNVLKNNCSNNLGHGISLKYSRSGVLNRNIANNNYLIEKPNTTGLIGYWKMDEEFWDGTEGEVKDSSGNGNNGTARNDATTTDFSMSGKAGEFDGKDDYVIIPNIIDGLSEITIEAWFNYANSLNWRWIYGSGSGFNYNPGFCIHKDTNLMRYHWQTNTHSFYGEDGSITLSPNEWNYIAFTYDGSQIKSYINGILDFKRNSSGTIEAYLTQAIGAGYWVNNEYFSGAIDEVRIYNRAISPEEILHNYNQFRYFDGIHLMVSSHHEIDNNTCIGNRDGICLDSRSNHNIVSTNTCLKNHQGINLYDRGFDNLVINNTCKENRDAGIHLFQGNSNMIHENIVVSNIKDGISIIESTNNHILYNNISSNGDDGIDISASNYNRICYNNFIDNKNNARDNGHNHYDDGDYGNYWSDFKERNPDARPKPFKRWMWNKHYIIFYGSNRDECPLVNQWPDIRPRSTARIQTTANSLLFRIIERLPNLFPVLRQLLGLF
jgi:parallel beta-helix repeat protein